VNVKQLTGFTDEDYTFDNPTAKALSTARTKAMEKICDSEDRQNSTLCERQNRDLGNLYIRTNKNTGAKYQLITSIGKHTNAILSCLE